MPSHTVLKGKLASHLWSDAANWTDGAPVAGDVVGVGAKRTVTLRLASAGSTKAQSAGELVVVTASLALADGELDLAPTPPASGSIYDLDLEKGATLTVMPDARLIGHQTLKLGLDGAGGMLRVYGAVAEDFALIASGRLAVAGSGHFIAGASGMAVGGANGAMLVVANGGVVDEGKLALSQYTNALFVGEGGGAGTVVVTGLGSLASFNDVYIGANGHGALVIANGGVVQDRGGTLAVDGDASALVTGQGSRWDNFGSLVVGEVYPTSTTLTVSNYGQVDWGVGGLYLNDTLRLDGSAALGGQTIHDGGEIAALAGFGTVYLEQDISIASNWLFNFDDVASVSAQKGAALELDGQITGEANSELRIASGDVIVQNAGNAYGFTELYSGVLEVRQSGALGAGALEFSGGTKAGAELDIEGQAQLSNLIEGFGVKDSIFLSGLHLLPSTTKIWTENAAANGGTLTLTSGGAGYALNFAGAYSAADFRLDANFLGGTYLSLAPHAT